ncbi:hypothetical protein GCM10022405_13740 [Gibbsiella dentisursi]|uniref:Uncharacterized protein n=1 Tax=Gibbsiella dentisursi TaxID=796890 RepID=A0ABP7KW84_9GAMM
MFRVKHRAFKLLQRRRQPPYQPLAGLRWGNAAGGAVKQAHAKALFHPANRLAKRRGGNAQMGRGPGEAAMFYDCCESTQFSIFSAAHYVCFPT